MNMTRGMGTPAIIALVAIVLVAGGALYVNTRPEAEKMMGMGEDMLHDGEAMMEEGQKMMQEGEKMMEEGEKMMTGESGAMMEKDNDSVMETGNAPLAAGSYEAYAPEKLAKAENGDVVLFFSASWCPTCRVLDKDIEANLDNIPTGVTILKTNYDRETALRQKYGVTRQHTMVQVAADGSPIAQWSGSRTLSQLLDEIQ